jgi:uncharacterized protein (TIGR02246 family)
MKTLCIVLVAFMLINCQPEKVDTKAEGEKLMQASRDWSDAAAKRDMEKVTSYWADNAILIAPGEPTLNGKNEIRKMVEESFKMPGFKISWEPKSVEISEDGTMGYLIEDSEMSFPDSTGTVSSHKVRGVSIWRKQGDGSWKNVVDVQAP